MTLASMVLAFGSCRSLASPGAQAGAAHGAPNIVYILADDMGYGDVSCLAESCAWTTPYLDRLGAEGMTFTDAHSGSAVCTPTRYGILTGRYAWRTRLAKGVLGGDSAPLLAKGVFTVGGWLQERGYHTACFGKWHLGWNWSRSEDSIDFIGPVTEGPHDHGFHETFCHSGSLDMQPYVWVQNGLVTAPPDRVTENTDYQGFWRKGPTGSDFDHVDVLPTLAQRAADYIGERSTSDDPFFLYLPLPAPHTPILPTPEFLGKSGTNPYGDFVLQVDDTVGQVLKALDRAGVSDNTIVIFTSDNGCSPRARFEELATFGHSPSHIYRGHKADIFEGGHRVPFLVRWPREVAPGTTSDRTTCLTDLFRTVADVLNAPLPDAAGPDSVSFLGALHQDSQVPQRAPVIHHSINGSFAVREGKWKLILCPGSGGWSDPKPQAARDSNLPPLQLYDLTRDPGETSNLADLHPNVATRLIAILDEQVSRGRSTAGPDLSNDRIVSFDRTVSLR